MNYYIDVLTKKYAEFSGRSRRAEYWMFALFNLIVVILLAVIEGILGTGQILGLVYSLGTLVPGLAVTVRRLHDTDRSGWWILISIIPLLGALILIYFLASDSTPGSNKYGPNPKGM